MNFAEEQSISSSNFAWTSLANQSSPEQNCFRSILFQQISLFKVSKHGMEYYEDYIITSWSKQNIKIKHYLLHCLKMGRGGSVLNFENSSFHPLSVPKASIPRNSTWPFHSKLYVFICSKITSFYSTIPSTRNRTRFVEIKIKQDSIYTCPPNTTKFLCTW